MLLQYQVAVEESEPLFLKTESGMRRCPYIASPALMLAATLPVTGMRFLCLSFTVPLLPFSSHYILWCM